MSLRVWWLVLIVGIAYWLYAERLMLAEETFLEDTFGDAFSTWASRTNAILPRLSNWQPSGGTLQLKRLSSEHNGLLDHWHRVSPPAVPGESLWQRPVLA